MRKIIFFALALLPSAFFAQSNPVLVWSAPVSVTTVTSYDNLRPQIALAQGDVPLVIWGRAVGGRHGYIARWNGAAFDTPTKINPTGSINAYTVEGPNVAAAGDTAYLVYVSYPSSSAQLMLRSSFDAGQTWNQPVMVDSLGADLPTFGNVAILPGGHPIVTYIRQTSTFANPRWVVRVSDDAGQTWHPEVTASSGAPGGLVCDCCTGETYVHEGKVVELFRNNNANLRDFWATVSTDGGLSFPTAIDLDSTDWTINACPSSGASALLQGDSIHTAFMSRGSSGYARIYVGGSSLATGQLGYNHQLSGGVPIQTQQNYPVMTGNGDTMMVAWMQTTGGDAEIFFRYSFHGISGLLNATSQNLTEQMGEQSFPDMIWANGKVHLVWQDEATNQVKYSWAEVGVAADVVGMAAGDWKLSPNPAGEQVELSHLPSLPMSIDLFDLQGQLLFRMPLQFTDHVKLDLAALPAGLYFIQVVADGLHLGTKKLVLKH